MFVGAVVAAAAFYQFRSPNIPDPDSLYHLHHAARYRIDGPLSSAFPWTVASIIRKEAADIWYGFHLLLVPATLTRDPTLGIKLAGAFLTAFLLVAVRGSLVRLGVRAASFWPFLLLFSGPNLLYHFTMTRPHLVTTALSALLFGLLVAPGGAVWVFVVASAITSIHLGLGWMIAMVLGAVLLVKALLGEPLSLDKAAAAAGGAMLGALLRPHPIGALKIAWVQIFGLTIARGRGEPLLLGKELFPITADVVVRHLTPMIAIWIAAIVIAIAAWRRGVLSRADARGRVLLGGSLLLSLAFFAMMFAVARRSFAPWALFAVVFVAGVVTHCLGRGDPRDATGPALVRPHLLRPLPARVLLVAGAGLFIFMAVRATVRHGTDLAAATPAGECRAAAAWIGARARPGDVVYNVHWDTFPKLFVWNDTQRYINGMDPIFEYAYDRGLYYESFHIQLGSANLGPATTCAWAVCTETTAEDTYTVLRRDFGASWLFVEKARSPALLAWAKSDPRFKVGYESETQAVFGLE